MSRLFPSMLLSIAIVATTCLAGQSATPAPILEPTRNPDALARQAAEQFMKAFKAEDPDAIMVECAVPFYFDDQTPLKDRQTLKARFENVFDSKDSTGIQFSIKKVGTAEKFGAQQRDKVKLVLKKALRKEDRAVLVSVESRKDFLLILVHIEGGRATIVGVFD